MTLSSFFKLCINRVKIQIYINIVIVVKGEDKGEIVCKFNV